MRGKQKVDRIEKGGIRITPADAGKTIDKDGVIVIGQDHPRGCGENQVCRKSSPHASGSPPRMRGKPINWLSVAVSYRITPADAGKTLLFCLRRRRRWDHPRGCGENLCT